MISPESDRFAIFDQSLLALGCWALGGKGWGGQSEKDSMEVMDAAYECGIRHFDTAQIYGVSEELVGRFLKGRREEVFLASKVYPKGGANDIRAVLHRSLEKLKTDVIDLYYLHWPVPGQDIRQQVEVLAAAKAEGLIRAIGVSNYSVEQIKQAEEVVRIDCLQSGFHLFWRKIEDEVLPYCRENGIRVISYSSLGQGILTGKFPLSLEFPQGDHRADRVIHFRPETWPAVHEAVEQIKPLAQEAGRPLSHLAIRWCASRNGIRSVLVGARSAGQVRENAAAMEGELDPSILDRMTRVSDALMPRIPSGGHIFDLGS
jgi:aryl-alcohol dehydrogenase-like predicted oxidoreductase